MDKFIGPLMGLVVGEGITIIKFARVVEQQLAQCGFGRWFTSWESKLYGVGS